jgi:hypothetical protein
MSPLLAPGTEFDVLAAHERVREAFISKLPEGRSTQKKGRKR